MSVRGAFSYLQPLRNRNRIERIRTGFLSEPEAEPRQQPQLRILHRLGCVCLDQLDHQISILIIEACNRGEIGLTINHNR